MHITIKNKFYRDSYKHYTIFNFSYLINNKIETFMKSDTLLHK